MNEDAKLQFNKRAYEYTIEKALNRGFPGFDLGETQALPNGCTAKHQERFCTVKACLRPIGSDMVIIIRYDAEYPVTGIDGIYSKWALVPLWEVEWIRD